MFGGLVRSGDVCNSRGSAKARTMLAAVSVLSMAVPARSVHDQGLLEGLSLIQSKLSRHLVDDFRRNGFQPVKKGSDQGLFADQIRDARNAARMTMDCFDRERVEDFLSITTGDSQSFENITARFFRTEG